MSSIEVIDTADIPARTSRHIKTGPLREKIASLTPKIGLFVSYYSDESNEGYRATTIAQIAGRMTEESERYRYSVQSAPIQNGCYIICKAKP